MTASFPLLSLSMTAREQSLLDARFSAASTYLEYGVGASTRRALEFPNIRRVDAIESGEEFLRDYLAAHADLRAGAAAGRLVVHRVDIGPTGPMGYPSDVSRKADWPAYAALPALLGRAWDLVLVDGRFRVACILNALLLPERPVLLVHDFWNRPQYHAVLEFSEVEERADTLVVLRPRRDCTERAHAMREMLARYAQDPQ